MPHIPPDLYNGSADKPTGTTKLLFVLRWVFLALAVAILLVLGYYRIAHSRLLNVEKLPSEQALRTVYRHY